MSGYQKLVNRIEQSTDEHPRSKVVIDALTLEIVAVSTNAKQIARTVRDGEANGRVLIVSQKSSDNHACILHTYGS